MNITEKWLKERNACSEGMVFVTNAGFLGLPAKSFIEKLIECKRLQEANWLIVRVLAKEDNIRYAIYSAEQVLDIFEKKYPGDKRPRKAIEAAKKYLKNPTEKNKNSAADAANAAYTAANAAYTAANAAYTAAS